MFVVETIVLLDTFVASMNNLCHILEHIVDGLDNTSFTEHYFVVHIHSAVLHISAYSRDDVNSPIEERGKK